MQNGEARGFQCRLHVFDSAASCSHLDHWPKAPRCTSVTFDQRKRAFRITDCGADRALHSSGSMTGSSATCARPIKNAAHLRHMHADAAMLQRYVIAIILRLRTFEQED